MKCTYFSDWTNRFQDIYIFLKKKNSLPPNAKNGSHLIRSVTTNNKSARTHGLKYFKKWKKKMIFCVGTWTNTMKTANDRFLAHRNLTCFGPVWIIFCVGTWKINMKTANDRFLAHPKSNYFSNHFFFSFLRRYMDK